MASVTMEETMQPAKSLKPSKPKSSKPKSAWKEKMLTFTVYYEAFVSLMLLLIGAAGLLSDLHVSSRILSTGIVQLILVAPGFAANTVIRKRRLWHLYMFLQFSIGVCELGWMIVSIVNHKTLPALFQAVCVGLQFWSAILTWLYLGLKGPRSFCSEMRKPRDETEPGFHSDPSVHPNSSTKEGFQKPPTPEYKTPPKKPATTRARKTSVESASKTLESKKETVEDRFERANASLKALVGTSKDIPKQAPPSNDDQERIARILKNDSESIKAKKGKSKNQGKRKPRYYFKEHADADAFSDSPESERERRAKRLQRKLLRREKRAKLEAARKRRESAGTGLDDEMLAPSTPHAGGGSIHSVHSLQETQPSPSQSQDSISVRVKTHSKK